MGPQTTTQLADYYAGLLIREYISEPRAFATIEQSIMPILMPQGNDVLLDNEDDPIFDNEGDPVVNADPDLKPIIPLAIQTAFNINPALGPTAVGKQLDIIGKYVGVKRVGFTFSGSIILDDTQFLLLIQIASARNILRADLVSIQHFIHTFFNGILSVVDQLNMRMTYLFLGQVGQNPVAEFFIKLGLLPKPLGVGLGALPYIFPSSTYFGFASYGGAGVPSYVGGMGSYNAQLTGAFLSYNNTIPI